MNMGRITVPLDTSEATALRHMAETDCRPPHDQMRYLLRTEGQRRGLIPADEQKKVAYKADKQPRDDQDSGPDS